MFKSIKQFIDIRLGKNIVLQDFFSEYGYFLKIEEKNLLKLSFFLKNDPDTKLILLDNIIGIPNSIINWPNKSINSNSTIEILYQLKSIKLPYKICISIEYIKGAVIPSLTPVFAGSAALEADLSIAYAILFETI